MITNPVNSGGRRSALKRTRLICMTGALIWVACAQAQNLTTLWSFNLATGGGLVQGADGNFYGTTFQGGGNRSGSVFKITLAGALSTIYNFGSTASDGFDPSGLTRGNDGNFYGTTAGGGAYGNGTAFKITPGGALTTLYSFGTFLGITAPTGATPESGLTLGTD